MNDLFTNNSFLRNKYELENKVRDHSKEFTNLLKSSSSLLALIAEDSRKYYGENGKLEWLDDIEDPKLNKEDESCEDEVEYNYYETFREQLPKKLEHDASKERWMQRILIRLERAIVWGERHAGSYSVGPRMRGVYTWLHQDGTKKTNANGKPLTQELVSQLLEEVIDTDNNSRDLVLYMDIVQVRKLAIIVGDRMKRFDFETKISTGHTSITLFSHDLEPAGMPTIVVDRDAPKGTILALSTDKIKLIYAPNEKIFEWDTHSLDVPEKQQNSGLIMTCSLKIQDHKLSHGMIWNLEK